MYARHVETPNLEEKVREILARYGVYMSECRGRLIQDLANAPHGTVVSEYFQHGKMLRALLVYIAAAAAGGDPRKVTFAAQAAELCHGASLFHDDIIDEADVRRSQPALHLRVGSPTALVIGDYLILRAFSVLVSARFELPVDRVLEAINILAVSGQECCGGQIEELAPSSLADSEEAYFSIVKGKTAALFAGAATVGALLAGGDHSTVEALRQYGLNLGIIFQIRDDMLDLSGESVEMGKPAGNSLANGRPLLPLIFLAEHSSPELRREFREWRQTGSDRESLSSLMERAGIYELIQALQEHYVSAAVTAIGELAPSAHGEALRTLAEYASRWGGGYSRTGTKGGQR